MKIGFIGLGNMAKAIIGGMLKQNVASAADIIGSDKTDQMRAYAEKEFGIRTVKSNKQVAAEADVLIFAIKPAFFSEVIGEIREEITKDKLLISIAAGKTIEWIEEQFGKEVMLIRCMPNTPALVGEGCTAICGNSLVGKEEEDFCIRLMGSFGRTTVIPERLIDAAGAVFASSPAYVFMFIEAMADGAVASGMPRGQAYVLAAQAVLGSAKMVLETGLHPGELKDMVCSPGGTTIEGVRILEEKGVRSAVTEAIISCVEKSKKL